MTVVDLPNGWTPRPYQEELWKALHGGVTRASLIAHRRWGKDDVAMHWTACAAFERAAAYWHMLPLASQARKAIWEAVNPHTGKRRIDEAFPAALRASTNDQEMFIRFVNGSTWRVVGSDNYDTLVGSPPAGVVLSEWALAKQEAWAYLSPVLAENGGWALFITTPRGRNHAARMHMAAMDDPVWWAGVQTVADTGAIAQAALDQDLKEKIDLFGAEIGRSLWEQEWYCSFDAATESALIPGSVVARAAGRVLTDADTVGRERIMGVDVARFGADRSVIMRRTGPGVLAPIVYEKIDNMDLAARVAFEARRFDPDAIFIDAGRGEGVIDRLRQLGLDVAEVNFGGRPLNPRYQNRKAEMWDGMRAGLEDWLALPGDHGLKTELSVPDYRFDNQNRLGLESKDEIKKRGLRSPDLADALALTFAAPVFPRGRAGAPVSAARDHDPYW